MPMYRVTVRLEDGSDEVREVEAPMPEAARAAMREHGAEVLHVQRIWGSGVQGDHPIGAIFSLPAHTPVAELSARDLFWLIVKAVVVSMLIMWVVSMVLGMIVALVIGVPFALSG